MSRPLPLYHEILAQITTHTPLAPSARVRLALLVTGIIAAQTTVLAQIARELHALRLTRARVWEHVARGLRRTLRDPALTPACYLPAVRAALPHPGGLRPLLVAVDESTHTDRVHLLRVAVPYRGNAVPLAWAVWEQNTPLVAGEYGQHLDAVFAQATEALPAAAPVCVVADRAYATPAFLDRCTAHGWRYAVRVPQGSHRWRDGHGREAGWRAYVGRRVPGPGHRWKGRGWLFKGAGWRKVAVVATWERDHAEPLVVVTNAGARWQVLAWYARRYWIEAGFRSDKSQGWQWEASGVQGVAHHAVLLVAMAWATLFALCLGVAAARHTLRRMAARLPPPRPQPARESVFTQGLRVVRAWLYGTRPRSFAVHLPHLSAPCWRDQWLTAQTVRP